MPALSTVTGFIPPQSRERQNPAFVERTASTSRQADNYLSFGLLSHLEKRIPLKTILVTGFLASTKLTQVCIEGLAASRKKPLQSKNNGPSISSGIFVYGLLVGAICTAGCCILLKEEAARLCNLLKEFASRNLQNTQAMGFIYRVINNESRELDNRESNNQPIGLSSIVIHQENAEEISLSNL